MRKTRCELRFEGVAYHLREVSREVQNLHTTTEGVNNIFLILLNEDLYLRHSKFYRPIATNTIFAYRVYAAINGFRLEARGDLLVYTYLEDT